MISLCLEYSKVRVVWIDFAICFFQPSWVSEERHNGPWPFIVALSAGSVPDYAAFGSLMWLQLDNNHLSGQLGPGFPPSLLYLSLNNNALTGESGAGASRVPAKMTIGCCQKSTLAWTLCKPPFAAWFAPPSPPTSQPSLVVQVASQTYRKWRTWKT